MAYRCDHCHCDVHGLWCDGEFVRWEENGTNLATCGSSDSGLHEATPYEVCPHCGYAFWTKEKWDNHQPCPDEGYQPKETA